jgi:hypothetical protein
VTPPLEEETNKEHNKKERELWGGRKNHLVQWLLNFSQSGISPVIMIPMHSEDSTYQSNSFEYYVKYM